MSSKFSHEVRELEPLEWDVPAASVSPTATVPGHAFRDARGAFPKGSSPGVRDHYIAARFPELARCGADLEKVAVVIESARRYFDERKTDRALELLDLAIEQCPLDEPLQLARLEIAFLLRDAALYTALAEEFRRLHGVSSAWPEVERLGRTLQGERAHGHADSSPRNWLPASSDAATESLAAHYHRVMARTAPPSAKPTLRAAA